MVMSNNVFPMEIAQRVRCTTGYACFPPLFMLHYGTQGLKIVSGFDLVLLEQWRQCLDV